MPGATPTPLPVPVCGGRLVLFGGSFDPPHRAHLFFARFLLGRFPEAVVLTVPAARSPHKASGPLASPEQRCAMLRLGLLDVGLWPADAPGAAEPAPAGPSARVGIWTDEIDRSDGGEGSYWIDTLRRARALIPPEVSLSFVVGSDQLAAFDRWREPHEILRLASPIVLVRGGGAVEDGIEVDEALAERLLEPARLAFRTTQQGVMAPTWSPDELSLFRAGILTGQPTMAISSTLVRERLRTQPGSLDLEHLLTPSVLAFLRRENPYARA
ncbi:MAG: nicotinate-nicotinamide nucleotide adenylyltransferase [Phycisphaerales bacterium]|nr:nicotinate-nicotinamide nucleotide adenylyltransferase [Phycisphaerales bacterium]